MPQHSYRRVLVHAILLGLFAMAAAIAMVPLSMALIGGFLVQGGLLQSAVIVVAVATAYAIRYALAPPGGESDAAEAAAAHRDEPSSGSAEAPA